MILNCSTNIVDCLRARNVNPVAKSSSVWSNCYASNALSYDTSSSFNSNRDPNGAWWSVDFKQKVAISMYQISSLSKCDWIKRWKASVSDDGKKWEVVSTPEEGHPAGKIYSLGNLTSARYFRIDKLNLSCGNMAFHYVKFFGFLLPNDRRCTSVRKGTLSLSLMLINIMNKC